MQFITAFGIPAVLNVFVLCLCHTFQRIRYDK